MRELGPQFKRNVREFAGIDAPVVLPGTAIRTGAEGPGEQFFVLKYKDKFSWVALEAYANEVMREAKRLRNEQQRLAEAEELEEFAFEVWAEANLARKAAKKTPTPLTPDPAFTKPV